MTRFDRTPEQSVFCFVAAVVVGLLAWAVLWVWRIVG